MSLIPLCSYNKVIVVKLVLVGVFAGSFAGCSVSESPLQAQLATNGSEWLLSEEPADVVGILEVREAGVPTDEISLIGRVGGASATWSPGEAAFVIRDPVADLADDHVCADGCAFCKKTKEKQVDPSAIIQFNDSEGKVLPIDARKLLPLEESQTVVVRGTASVDAIGNLVVNATGIYIRR